MKKRLNQGRLANGDILVSGGRDLSGATAIIPEVYSAADNRWRSLFGASLGDLDYWYPRQWVTSNSEVFGFSSLGYMYNLNATGNGELRRIGRLPLDALGRGSTAAMYQPGKILQVGGGAGTRSNGAVVIDITDNENPSVRLVDRPKKNGRVWSNSVILPDGDVLLVGGSSWNGDVSQEALDSALDNVSNHAELWNPQTERWSTLAAGKRARLYHSTALLLPDGRVLVAGGGAPGPVTNRNAELFSPPNLFDGNTLAPRPTISSAPKSANYGSKIEVRHPSGNNIARVTLIKTGAVTHAYNMEQRFLELAFDDISTGVRVTMPSSASNATPGYYLMFLIDNKGTPSKGSIIKLSQVDDDDSDTEYAPPIATPDTANAINNQTITVDVLSNDIGTGLTLEPLSSSYSLQAGRVSISNQKIQYTAPATFTGEDTVYYVIKDSQGATAFTSLKIQVDSSGVVVTQPPVGRADFAVTRKNTPVLIDVLSNDSGTDIEIGDFNEYSAKAGQITKRSQSELYYTPRRGFTGKDTFWYTVVNASGRPYGTKVTVRVKR